MCITHADESVEISGTRLPTHVVPVHYNLTFEPDLSSFTFTGKETIDLKVLQSTRTIVINSAELEIADVVLSKKSGRRIAAEVSFDETNEFAIFTFPHDINKGKYKLSLKFKGILNDKLHGFYRSVYKGADGKDRVIASTQMEPADARRAFPSFDEPAFKATYSVTLDTEPQLTALSNGRRLSRTLLPNGKERSRFKKTIPMSTYLVAMVIGGFIESRSVTANGVKIRIFHVPGKEAYTDLALTAAEFAIKYCEDYFKIKYPGDKLDLIGIPDFAFGAMENLGCMIFRETALLVDPKTATIADMARVFEVVAHEIVHSWFGDLVTMAWWNGLWLNEAFATFVSQKIVHAAHPEWNIWEQFAAGRRGGAMRTDGLMTTRPIQSEVHKASDALGMVDGITYGKGSGVLWQLEQFIGEDVFRDGVRVYLKKHSFGNTLNSDLWDAIGSQTEQPVRVMMDSWIFQPGHPVVTVSDCDDASHSHVKLTQKRFFYGEPVEKEPAHMVCSSPNPEVDWSNAGRWLIPVNLRFESESGVQNRWVLLDAAEQSIHLENGVKWVVANAGGTGFYRTAYDTPLTSKVAVSELSVLERFNLVNDTWACVRAGLVTSTDYHDIIQEFANETDPDVIGVIIGSLGSLQSVLPEENKPAFRKFIRDLFNPALERVGWEERAGESTQDKQLRGQLISTLGCTGRDAAVEAKGKLLFRQWLADKSSVPANVAPSLLWITADTGDAAQYAEFQALYEATNNPQEKVRFLYALGYFRDKELLRKTLASTITKAVRTQDAPALISMLLGSDIKEEAWQFVQQNWDYMVAHFPETGLIGLVGGFASLSKPHLEEQVRDFVSAREVRGGSKQVSQMLENLRLNVAFRERELERMVTRFAADGVAQE